MIYIWDNNEECDWGLSFVKSQLNENETLAFLNGPSKYDCYTPKVIGLITYIYWVSVKDKDHNEIGLEDWIHPNEFFDWVDITIPKKNRWACTSNSILKYLMEKWRRHVGDMKNRDYNGVFTRWYEEAGKRLSISESRVKEPEFKERVE